MPSPKTTTKKTTKNNTKTTTTDKKESTMDSVQYRKQTRDEALHAKDTRKFNPLDMALISGVVVEGYETLFDEAIKSKKETTVRIDLSDARDFLRGWMKANGANRTPKPSHYLYLCERFAEEFASSATHWVVASNGMITNAGHSGIGFARAYYPEDIFYGIFGEPHRVDKELIEAGSEAGKALLEDPFFFASEHDGRSVIFASYVPPRPEGVAGAGEYDENGKWIPGTDSPEKRVGLQATLVVNAPPESCLKMDDVRLQADYADFLEMVGPLRAYLPTLPGGLDNATIASILLTWYKRINHKTTSDSVTYGMVGKGGRPTKSDVQIWAIQALPQLRLCLELLMDANGKQLAAWPLWSKSKTEKGGINTYNGLVAMMVSDDKGREKIAKLLKRTKPADLDSLPPQMAKFRADVIVDNKPRYSSLNADTIVEALILFGMGKTEWYDIATTVEDDSPNPWQIEENRAPGWDRNEDDQLSDGIEDFNEVQTAAAKSIAKILGDTSSVESAERKQTRKGQGKRGPNPKK